MSNKNKMILKDSTGRAHQVTDKFLKVVYDSLDGSTLDSLAAKLTVSICLFGADHPNSQDLYNKAALQKTDK